MSPESIYQSLIGRLTDANRAPILAALRQETGFSRLDLFASTAGTAERVRVLSKLLAMAHGGQFNPVAPLAGSGAIPVVVETIYGGIPVERLTTGTPQAADAATEAIERLVNTPGVRVLYSVHVQILMPEPKGAI